MPRLEFRAVLRIALFTAIFGFSHASADVAPECAAAPTEACLLAAAVSAIADIPDPAHQVGAFLAAARGLHAAGDEPGARAAFADALEAAGRIDAPDWFRSLYFADTVLARTEIGDFAGARETLAAVTEDDLDRRRAMLALVRGLLAAGDIPGAIEIAKSISVATNDTEVPRASAWAAIAIAQVAAGDRAAALLSIYEADEALHAIDLTHFGGGAFPGPSHALVDLAVAQVKAGYFHAGLGTAAEAVTLPLRFTAIRAVFAAYAGDLSAMLSSIDYRWGPEDTVAALLGLAEAGITAGDAVVLGEALAFAVDELGVPPASPYFYPPPAEIHVRELLQLAEIQRLAGDLAAADRTLTFTAERAADVEDAGARAGAFLELARMMGLLEQRTQFLGDALAAARQLEPRSFTPIATAVAEARAADGDIAGALDLARELEAAGDTGGYVAVARQMAVAGDVGGAIALADGIADPENRCAALLAIAGAIH